MIGGLTSLIENFSLIIKVGVFSCFFLAAAIAVRYNENKQVRTGFLAIFITFIIVSGLTGLYVWPFFSFHLFESPGSEQITFHELRVADGEGQEIRYDARAAPPIVGSISRRYSNAMVGAERFSTNETLVQACYFLSQAREYREQIDNEEQKVSITPRHQRDFRWTAERLNGFNELDRIRIYSVEATIATDGSRVSNQSSKLILEVTQEQCDNVY